MAGAGKARQEEISGSAQSCGSQAGYGQEDAKGPQTATSGSFLEK